MSIEIGFNLYDKQTFDATGQFKRVEIDLPFMCGRNELVSAWGNYFRDTDGAVQVPVFQKELDGKINATDDYYEEHYKYVSFEDFAHDIAAVSEELNHKALKYRDGLRERVHVLNSRIKELRLCQMECTADNGYAFDKWSDEIQDLYREIDDIKDGLRTFDHDDDNLVSARNMQKIINTMRRYLSDGRYYVIPYFSY